MREYFVRTDRIGFSKWGDSDFHFGLLLWRNSEVTEYIFAEVLSEEKIRQRFEKEVNCLFLLQGKFNKDYLNLLII